MVQVDFSACTTFLLSFLDAIFYFIGIFFQFLCVYFPLFNQRVFHEGTEPFYFDVLDTTLSAGCSS